jgi:alpha-tubulin suppressor-like RCC1 family protein
VELPDVIAADGGAFHTCACTRSGRVFCWGRGAEGQLGTGHLPAASPTAVPGITDCRDVAAGAYHTCVLGAAGGVACFGRNDKGQLGSGWKQDAAQIAANGDYTCVRTRGGTVSCWGSNETGQLGAPGPLFSASPAAVAGIDDARDLALAARFACVIRGGGRVVCWGSWGSRPQPGDTVTDAVSLTAGLDHVCALRRGGRAVCWGANNWGQLGNGTRTYALSPVTVVDVTNFSSLAAGEVRTRPVSAAEFPR